MPPRSTSLLIELRAGLPGRTEQQAVELLDAKKAHVSPEDMPLGLGSMGCLILLAVIAGFLMTGTGAMALAHPSNNVGSPVLLIPGIILFGGGIWAKSSLNRRIVPHLARMPRRDEQ
ncbi:hypothetical protein ACFVFQ_31680 [Streptomyces sp. NPDC057743]|uniref:hypothetical protein n=1 Tax=Streptomyces sp. NPDC057743 TaxID=3346236 RepID=UPI003687EDA9